ncbi:MAG: hypothetical protein PHQ59_00745 [Candidatus Daviesbacteria bacterium]|nr:hypothetical protein [Candidatus Daviesbacteria bacterium]
MNQLLAANPSSVIGTITPPPGIKDLVDKGGAGGINSVLTSSIILIYQVAIVLFVFMIVFGALQWIISGGEKEKIAAAQGRITNAVIGLVILGLAWVIVSVLGNFTGIKVGGV